MLFIWSFLLTFSASYGAEKIIADHIEVSLIAPKTFASKSEHIAVHFKPQTGWHIYWKNPGDSGAAPKFAFSSKNANFSDVLWPLPERIPIGPLVNIGYSGDVVYPILVTPKSDDSISANIKLEWLVCKEECLPGFGVLTFTRTVSGIEPTWHPQDQELLKHFLAEVPADESSSPYQIASAVRTGNSLDVQVRQRGSEAVSKPDLFPVDGTFLLPAAPKVTETEAGVFNFNFQVQSAATAGNSKPVLNTSFVLASGRSAWHWSNVPVTLADSNVLADSTSLWILLASAFLGGLLLNLMPCVFPVLSIKLFSLMNSATSSRARVREGLFYTLGVLCTFAALGVVFLLLRRAGQNVGWGFQLQSPVVVYALAILFWLMGLNFLGIFEFGEGLMNVAGRQSSHSSSFATGILSVFIAAPCTGPFMGSALGASATLPPAEAMSIFLGLGFGLAFPFLVLAASPGLARRLPKPGAWMEKLKQFFAFPMFATVLWLLWVLQIQTGSNGWLSAAGGLFVISLSLWIGKTFSRAKLFAWGFAILILGLTTQQLKNSTSSKTNAVANWSRYDAAKVNQARAAGQAVFIDFTAAWCITCQVNKKVVLETDAAQKLFAENKVLLIRADWTSQDPNITTALSEFGRNSVPVYVYYDAVGSAAKILPQILTMNDIEELFKNSNEENEK
ncbi:MAG: thioredoxin family protein [Bdellovibrionaceae bacterium]|nr:thioredoxin family protein [Pseudobdellovibrionaceae bacterium]